jgi:uncharacterized protein
MREDILKSILDELKGSSKDIQAAAAISTDGLVMYSVLSSDMDEDRMGAMAAAMLSLGERISDELGRGELEQVLIKGKEGYVLMTHAGPDTVVCVVTQSAAKLGLVFLDIKRAAESISKII